jgi:hypothetical protein
MGWRCSSVVDNLPSMYQTLGWSSNTMKQTKGGYTVWCVFLCMRAIEKAVMKSLSTWYGCMDVPQDWNISLLEHKESSQPALGISSCLGVSCHVPASM